MAEWVRALACAGDRTVRIGFESHCGKLCFGMAIPFTPLCQCLSEETLKAVGPLYLVSMAIKRCHQSLLGWTPPLLEKDNSMLGQRYITY